MKKIAVFASGGGTDFQSIIDANEREAFCKIEFGDLGAVTTVPAADVDDVWVFGVGFFHDAQLLFCPNRQCG